MRILIVSNLYPPVVFGGYEILCHQAVSELKKRGHAACVLTSDFMPMDSIQELDPDVAVKRILKLTTNFPKPGETVGFVDFSLRALHRISQINHSHTLSEINRFKPDVVFCWCLNRLGIGSIFAAQDAHVPVCYTINDEHPKQFSYVRQPSGFKDLLKIGLQRQVWSKATLAKAMPFPMMIISQALKNNLLKQGAPVEEADVIHQGVDAMGLNYAPLGRQPGEALKLCYVGQISRAKGVHTILGAMDLLRKSQPEIASRTVLDIAGSGVPDYMNELHEFINSHGLGDSIHFVGKIGREEIPGFFHSHHIKIFSSEWEEPFGLAHLEAMACGCAVISTTTGGSAELIMDEVNALAYQAGNADSLCEKIADLAKNEAKRVELSRNARRHVEEKHSFHKYMDQAELFLRKTIESKGIEKA